MLNVQTWMLRPYICDFLSRSVSFLSVVYLYQLLQLWCLFSVRHLPQPSQACDTQALLGSFSGGWAGGATTGGHVSGSCQHLNSVSGVDASKQTVKLQVLIQFSFHR